MPNELSYLLITPYSLHKSRTGGVIARLMADPELELVGISLISPNKEFLEAYAKSYEETDLPGEIKKQVADYIRNRFLENTKEISNRGMLLFFRGEKSFKHLQAIVGHFEASLNGGNTIRGIHGDCVKDVNGKIEYFEPAVLGGISSEHNKKQLQLLLDLGLDGTGIVEDALSYPGEKNIQTTLVILKPDNFFKSSTRPGNIITTFSRTGLNIIAARILHLNLDQGNEFYGPLMDVFPKVLRFKIGNAVKEYLAPNLPYELSDEDVAGIEEVLAQKNAQNEFNQIVKFMTGLDPAVEKDTSKPGSATAIALLYRGPDAIAKIRERLGATNPDKAEVGTVRSDFASSIMVNSAHASDAPENAIRERKIIGLLEDDGKLCKKLVQDYLA
jgi:nucleoside diphosphate kinase